MQPNGCGPTITSATICSLAASHQNGSWLFHKLYFLSSTNQRQATKVNNLESSNKRTFFIDLPFMEKKMNARQKILVTAFVALFSGAMVAHAADEAAAAEQAKPAKKKVSHHSHAVEKGTLPPSAAEPKPSSSGAMDAHKNRHSHPAEKGLVPPSSNTKN